MKSSFTFLTFLLFSLSGIANPNLPKGSPVSSHTTYEINGDFVTKEAFEELKKKLKIEKKPKQNGTQRPLVDAKGGNSRMEIFELYDAVMEKTGEKYYYKYETLDEETYYEISLIKSE